MRTLIACLAALVAVVCDLGPASAQTLRIGINNDPDILDPTMSRTYVGTVVMSALCDKLVDFDAKLNLVPRLATSWEWTDSQTLVMHLRPNVLFQDGEKFDAAAVKYTIDRNLTFPQSFRRAEILSADHIEIVDPLAVRIVMKQPAVQWVAALTDRSGMMVSPRAAEAAGPAFGQHPVCAGPFKFAERVAQDHITLERFPLYWDASAVHFDKVTYRVMTDSAVRLANLQAGALDLTDIVPTDVDTVKRDPNLVISSAGGLGYAGLTINLGKNPRAETPLGRDARVRQALSLSIDRDAVIQVVFNGQYEANAQPVSSIHPLHVDTVKPPARDVAKAKALLAEAGVKLPIPVSLTIANSPQNIQVAEVIQSMVREAGFDLQVTTMDFGASLSATQKGDFAVSIGGWSGLLDPDSNVWQFLHTGGSLNIAQYSNPDVDTSLDQARAASDPAQRRALYAKVWEIEGRDLPIIYLWTPRYIFGHTAKLTGFQTMPDGLLRLQGVSLAPQ